MIERGGEKGGERGRKIHNTINIKLHLKRNFHYVNLTHYKQMVLYSAKNIVIWLANSRTLFGAICNLFLKVL